MIVEGRFVAADEWLDIGDLGRLDERGNLTLFGRADHVILRGARRIDPTQVEAALLTHPRVAHAAVTTRPSRVAGEPSLVALVVADGSLSSVDVKRHMSALRSPVTIPSQIVFVDALPLTTDGAVRRHLLPAVLADLADVT